MGRRAPKARLKLRRQACTLCRREGHNRATCGKRDTRQTWLDV